MSEQQQQQIDQLVAITSEILSLLKWSPADDENGCGKKMIRDIQDATAEHFKMTRMELLATRRTDNLTRARYVAMFLAKELTSHSLSVIGRAFAGRDHTTVHHAIGKVNGDPARYAADLAAVRTRLRA